MMGFWRDLWNTMSNVPASQPVPEWDFTLVDPDWKQRQELQAEKRRLTLRQELLQLAEDNDRLREECMKMEKRREDYERRHG